MSRWVAFGLGFVACLAVLRLLGARGRLRAADSPHEIPIGGDFFKPGVIG